MISDNNDVEQGLEIIQQTKIEPTLRVIKQQPPDILYTLNDAHSTIKR